MNKRNVFWGLFFILAAILIFINQIGFFPGVSMIDIFLTVLMTAIIIVSVRRINFWGILLPLAIILIIYSEELNITQVEPWSVLLVAFLISFGLSLVFNKHGLFSVHFNGKDSFTNTVENDQDSNIINCSTSFGECIKYVNSENFERANISCSFGDIKMYFDNAKIPSGKANIYLNVSFGDLVLYIPREWNVENRVRVLFGDIDTTMNNVVEDSPLVTIHGNISFGDVKIIFV